MIISNDKKSPQLKLHEKAHVKDPFLILPTVSLKFPGDCWLIAIVNRCMITPGSLA